MQTLVPQTPLVYHEFPTYRYNIQIVILGTTFFLAHSREHLKAIGILANIENCLASLKLENHGIDAAASVSHTSVCGNRSPAKLSSFQNLICSWP